VHENAHKAILKDVEERGLPQKGNRRLAIKTWESHPMTILKFLTFSERTSTVGFLA
jgi:hypothetical protein